MGKDRGMKRKQARIRPSCIDPHRMMISADLNHGGCNRRKRGPRCTIKVVDMQVITSGAVGYLDSYTPSAFEPLDETFV
jgi:hypothetical protein